MHFYKIIAVGLTLLPFGFTIDCTPANAIPYYAGSGSRGISSNACARLCGNDKACQEQCEPGKKLKTRQTLNCTADESCYLLMSDNILLCLNDDNGLYHDENGGHGDRGTYTDAAGKATTFSARGKTSSILTSAATSSTIVSTSTLTFTSPTSAVIDPITSTSSTSTSSVPSTGVSATVPLPNSTANSAVSGARGSGAFVVILGLLLYTVGN